MRSHYQTNPHKIAIPNQPQSNRTLKPTPTKARSHTQTNPH
ncbi:hypothetical protein [Brunnivagina elsteri]|nr:hypothetical protein [Calothrix elsteri]